MLLLIMLILSQKEKSTLGLRIIDVSHNANNIVEHVLVDVDEYSLTNNVPSITLYNASASTKAMETPTLYGYVGDLSLLQQFSCHIINLYVKALLDVFKPMLRDLELSFFASKERTLLASHRRVTIGIKVGPSTRRCLA